MVIIDGRCLNFWYNLIELDNVIIMKNILVASIIVSLSIVGVIYAEFVTNSNNTYVKKDYGDSILFYDNCVVDSSLFVSFLNNKLVEESFVSLPINDKQLKSIKIESPIIEKVTLFFANCNSINRWSVLHGRDYIISRNDAINRILCNYNYFYYGRVVVSEDFDSFLFARVYKASYPRVDECLLVNKKGDTITCVARLFDYFCFDGHEEYSRIYEIKDFYRYEHITSYGDLMKSEVKKEYIDFVFDSDGSILVKMNVKR